MKYTIILLAILLTGCGTLVDKIVVSAKNDTEEAAKSCADYCASPSCVSYRSKTTFICECFDTNLKPQESVVVGKSGTIYK